MAISSSSSTRSSSNKVQTCSKKCLESFNTLQKNFDNEKEKHNRAREIKINNLNIKLEKVVKERDELKLKIEKWEGSSKNLTKILNSQMSAHDKNGLGFGTQIDKLSNKSETNSENSMTVFEVRSSDEESTLGNSRFTKATEYHVVPPLIIGNPLTPRADTSFAGLDEYAIRNKTIESKTPKTTKTLGNTNDKNVKKPKSINEKVVSKTGFNRDEVIIEDWTLDDEEDMCPINTVSSIKTKVTQAIRSQAVENDYDFYEQKSPEPRVKKVINTAVLTRTGLVNVVKTNVNAASAIRPNHLKLDIVRPKASNSPIKRSYNTQPVYRPKNLKPDVKTFRVKNITTVRSRAVVSKGKVENVLEKAKWVWRPKGNPEYVLQDHAVVDSGCSSHMTGNKAYLSDYEDFNGGFVAFGSDPKGGRITGKALNFLMKVKLYLELLGKHNMVAFLKKPNESVGFTEVVDFLKGTSLRTLANGNQQLEASIDSKEYIIIEASIKSKLQLADATGVNNLSDADIYAGLATLGGYAGDIVPLLPAMLVGAAVDQGEGSAQPAEPKHTPVNPIPFTSQPPIPSPPLQPPSHLLPHSTPHSPLLSPPHSPPHYSPPRSNEAPLYKGHTSGKDEELEDQGRKIKDIDDDPLVTLVRESMKDKDKEFVTPTKGLGEAQESEISPITLEAAKTLSKVASQGVSKGKSTDKGKRYRRRARSVAKDISTGIEAQRETNNGFDDINTGFVEINIGSTKVSTGSIPVSTASKVGQREGKAPMIEEDIQATLKTKEQLRQEEAGLEEAIKLQAQLDEEAAKQVHFDALMAKRMVEEEALSEQQEKRKAQVQFEAQYYTEEDWDAIRAKLEANAELTKDVLGKDLPEEDFAKRMVEMVNQRKKHFAEEKAKAKRDKPMTQLQLRTYMSNYLKNQGTWKLSQLKKLSFEEIKEEFDKLVHQIGTFVPMESEASVKRQEKDKVVKDEEAEVLVKKVGMRMKQKARKGIKIDKAAQDKSKEEREAFMKENIKGASSE
ncbi:hypothetical protein Tco_1217089 [Tanacetum coccineum]